MKYTLIFLLFLCGCTEVPKPIYPGQRKMSVCWDAWEHHVNVNVNKCEEWLNNPKFKIGQKVKIKDKTLNYEKSCYGIIRGTGWWIASINQGQYALDVYCNRKLIDRRNPFYEGILESNLK